MLRMTTIDSPIGPLMITLDASGALAYLAFDGWRNQPAVSEVRGADADFEPIIRQVTGYFAGEVSEFDVDLAPDGNEFQRSVWELLCQIPYGETRTYGELATALGDRSLARSIGTACASNPIALIIPCHRVIGADGSLTGFGGGLDRKEYLLHLENPERPLKPRLFA